MNDSKEKQIRARKDRPFDVNRWSDYPELRNCLTDLIQEIEDWERQQREDESGVEFKPKRSRKDAEAKRLREAVRCIVLDLYVAWKTDPELLVGINLRKNHYSNESRYRALFLGYSSFRTAYDGLRELGYLRIAHRGFKDRTTGRGLVTRIAATVQLIRLLTDKASLSIPAIRSRVDEAEVILLRDEAKKPMEYDDTDETRSMRVALQRINAHLQRQWLDIRIPDSEFEKLQQRMQRDYVDEDRERPFIDFTQRTLVRIFNNGDWQQGGRFYRGWWQSIPKECRRFITINDKRTVEIDYSSLHPVLLYAQVGERLEGKAYDIGRPDIRRELIKETFNKMVNARGTIRKPQEFDEHQFGMTWEEFQNAIAARHEPIRRFFNTGFGVQLQRIDSDIAQKVMLRFNDMTYTCLPVHDSFLVHYDLADELKNIMKMTFKDEAGQDICVKTSKEVAQEYGKGLVKSSIGDLLGGEGEYANYEKRWLDWQEYRNNQ